MRDAILTEREATHGSFRDNARVWVALLDAMWWYEINHAPHEQNLAVTMIMLKLARLAQNPKVKDHWDDIAGYAKLGAEACNE